VLIKIGRKNNSSVFKRVNIIKINQDNTLNKKLLPSTKKYIASTIISYEKDDKYSQKNNIYLITDKIHYNYFVVTRKKSRYENTGEEEGEEEGEENEEIKDNLFSETDEEIDDGFVELEESNCEKCGTKGKYTFKSKNFNKKNQLFENVYFCSIKCFQNFEDWNKFKK